MSTKKLYDTWSSNYDTVENKTRDLEELACRQKLSRIAFNTVIELGAGTGKNTGWLAALGKEVLSVDLSEEMLAVAKAKVEADNVTFIQADITEPWKFDLKAADLITCSLILEHVADLDFVFRQAFAHLSAGGHFYICELHPFKQYTGSKARFESEEGLHVLECFTHHISDFTASAASVGFTLDRFDEWFDEDDRNTIPRLASFLFQRAEASAN